MKIFLSIFLFFTFSTAYSQAYHITYSMKGKPRIYKELSPEMNRQANKVILRKESIFVLNHSLGKSKFFLKETLIDGEISNDPRYGQSIGVTYKNFGEGYFMFVHEAVGKNTAVKERFSDIYNWQIVPNSDTIIAGFECKKATSKYYDNDLTVWFSPSMPIMDGPFRYAGLPGLILREESILNIIEVVDVQILGHNMPEIVIPKKDKYISHKEFIDSRTLTVKAKRPKRKE